MFPKNRTGSKRNKPDMRKSTLYISFIFLSFVFCKASKDLYAQTSQQTTNELVLLPKVHKGTLEIDTWLLNSNEQMPDALRQFYLDTFFCLSSIVHQSII